MLLLSPLWTIIGNIPSEQYRICEFAGRVTYSYAGKYIAEFSASDTGCDDYAKGHRFGFFPAGSAGWVISEEPWLKNFRNVNHLKLKVLN